MSDEEIRDDVKRFIYHESMRANVDYDKIITIIKEELTNN